MEQVVVREGLEVVAAGRPKAFRNQNHQGDLPGPPLLPPGPAGMNPTVEEEGSSTYLRISGGMAIGAISADGSGILAGGVPDEDLGTSTTEIALGAVGGLSGSKSGIWGNT